MAEIDWEQVREFTLGTVARPATRKRNRIEWGPKAIRVPQGVEGRPGLHTVRVRRFHRWSEPGPRREAAAGRLFTGVLDAVFSAADEGGDQATKERVLEWRADGEVVVLSEGTKSVTVTADWLDRRLLFAYVLVAG